jgi:CubicO group peptidase (beta-lactamase class C family)
MGALEAAVDDVALTERFSGVVRVDRDGTTELAKAYGLADRSHGVANAVETQFGVASGVKGMTAATVVSLVADGTLSLAAPVRTWLRDDLPLVDDSVTIEHLLAHTSGIGDYFDEEAGGEITDYVLRVPGHRLATTEDYVEVLDGFPAKFAPGERFSYCNGGFVVLALVAERASGVPFADLVAQRVCAPAGMVDTAFLRSDALPGRAARGYVTIDGETRSNVFHLPVRGSGDGGIYTTVADVHAFWDAFDAGKLVPPEWAEEMTRPRNDVPEESRRYGLGFWLHASRPVPILVGYDAGVSFCTVHDAEERMTYTVIANTSEGAWPVSRALDAHLGL